MRRRASVPARVNIIGEHTDYAGGLALPFTINSRLELEANFSATEYIGDATIIELWKEAGGPVAELKLQSDIPIGKGLSSSAALCIAIASCVTGQLANMQTCHLAQQIEHRVLGTKCGLLDQMAMVYAKQGYATMINFSTYSIENIEMPRTWKFKLIDSGIHRKLADTNYGPNLSKNSDHVIAENNRVMQAQNASAEELGDLLNKSHESLINLGVSLPSIDSKVSELQQMNGVLGARMMGGGFGGMILVLVNDETVLPEYPLVESSGPATLEIIL